MDENKKSSSDFYNGVRRRPRANVRWRITDAERIGVDGLKSACARTVVGQGLPVPCGHWWAADTDPLGRTVFRWAAIPADARSRETAAFIIGRAVAYRCQVPCISTLTCDAASESVPSDGWDGEAWKIARKTVFKGMAAAAVARFDGPRPHIHLFHDGSVSSDTLAAQVEGFGTSIGDIEGNIERPGGKGGDDR